MPGRLEQGKYHLSLQQSVMLIFPLQVFALFPGIKIISILLFKSIIKDIVGSKKNAFSSDGRSIGHRINHIQTQNLTIVI